MNDNSNTHSVPPVNGTDDREARSKFWIAVYTRPRSEKKAASELNKLGIETYLPIQRQLRKWSDRKKIVDVAGDERVICGGGGHHDHFAADQFLAPLLLICQVIAHTEYSFLLPGEVHASPGLFFAIAGIASPYQKAKPRRALSQQRSVIPVSFLEGGVGGMPQPRLQALGPPIL